MTEAFGVRRCRGCGQLLLARDRCACDTATVHVITTLGPTPGMPGQRQSAQMLGDHGDRLRDARDTYTSMVDQQVENLLRRASRAAHDDQQAMDRLNETLRRNRP